MIGSRTQEVENTVGFWSGLACSIPYIFFYWSSLLIILLMGQAVAGTREIKYKTKDGIPISYIFYDLKGKNRFPT